MSRIFIIISLLMLSACSTVQPWEKDLLAKPSMALVADENENFLDDHIYFSKEGATGGQGVGGGGCGCN
ncbi:Phosphonate ABC transporter phosphate-binding periplasmic component (TC 3.A.1.9.1) [hydrothermal vent metagenome]|uniref:Phosphonate ABC transporter phosphate-binding periplasmic component (TC 3.A.1.9.1) n=1 Tax=hydrothermal vent metagenome TaxID=652676 RepID=A0A3B0WN09_9ZZZZ